MMRPDQLLDAMRVPDSVVPRRVGLWEITRLPLGDILRLNSLMAANLAPYRSLTLLFRDTAATMMNPLGECVMEDSPQELRRHLPIMIHGRGRILISGLGLGCVVRGLMAKPDVEHVDVIEIDPSIISLVGREFEGNPRVTIHVGNAETVPIPDGRRWDYAWHDVWSETESLAVVHARLIARFDDVCDRQGAWMMPRLAMQFMPKHVIGGPRRRRKTA